MSPSSNAVFITGKLDETFIALVTYTLLSFTYRAFDNAGESSRSVRAQMLEAALFGTPHAIKQHTLAQPMRSALEADGSRFLALARDVLMWPRMGDEFNPDTIGVGFSKDERRQMARAAFAEMAGWLDDIRRTSR